MTESEWDACDDPTPMLEFVRSAASERKLRLFAVACCRRIWDQIRTDRSIHHAVEAAELYADGWPISRDLPVVAEEASRTADSFSDTAAAEWAWAGAWTAHPSLATNRSLLGMMLDDAAKAEARAAANCAVPPRDPWKGKEWELKWQEGRLDARKRQADLLRDLFGSPFRPAALDPAWLDWRDGLVRVIATSIYTAGLFHHLPLLADALENAGCADADLLGHLRGPGPHARGCWALDLILDWS